MKIKVTDLRDLLLEILEKRNIEGKEIITNHFIEAELRGHSSHGIQRIIPLIKGVELGTIKSKLDYEVLIRRDNQILIDAKHSIGIVLWDKLIDEFIANVIAVKNASHIGFLGYYTRKVARKGRIGIMFGNAEPAVVMPGTSKKILSTTPLSISIPTNPPIVLDMALASTARGKIIEALRKGEKIPYGVAVNEKGEITTDPNEALKGGILPIGGMKGFFLMLTLELLTSFLTGSAVGPEVRGVLNTENPPNKGEVLITLDPLASDTHGVEIFKGFTDLPGWHSEKMSTREYLDIDDILYRQLEELNRKVPYFR
ncbi:Ldh family oxidoreductase [Sulfurisphaera javensis]|uniref:Ldh family oxidoreductase n=1 Tax=Sulfurisphaera javensis TaxID=2049879 RepID=A0AAT9GQ90_9CREN